MIIEIPKQTLFNLLVKQIRNLFLLEDEEYKELENNFNLVLIKVEKNFSYSDNKYYIYRENMLKNENKSIKPYFNPFHSGQYTIFLYYFSYIIGKCNILLADKLYYLNKVLNGCDLFHQVELPDIFFLDHPVGSVMGRAQYDNYFSFSQNCTVGNNNGIYPVIGKNVRMCANSMILGNCRISDNVTLGANACVKDENVPENSIVFGASPNLIIKSKR
jgi:serine O-acetyltransferase